MQFQNLFTVVENEDSDAILKYVFTWSTTRENLNDAKCNSSLAEKVKQKVLDGHSFHESLGIIEK